ncbi:hypothetical protein [Agrococcus jejuensis]|uniref:Uncharacterized protein n=1 Tax=Agrococcus jejuensis TaxID=399736 RepID=A0A1G7ZMI5_9MICO|nr:hypothetical protein [Agrococcus jejuensis]SDH09913.1 hypothetical protein SAMN04489720_0029 [Agrococcus jejuensis]
MSVRERDDVATELAAAGHHRTIGGRHRRIPARAGMGARTRGWLVAAVAVTAIVGVGGTANAVWSAQGSGSGTSTTGTASASVALSEGASTGSLRPGASVAVATTATNPNAADVRITSLVLDTARGSSGFGITGASGTCPASAFTFSESSAGWNVPANGSTTISLSGALAMTSSAPSGCQGATVTVYLKAGS